MPSPHRFVVKDYSLRGLVGAAYNLTPTAISGGPAWIDSDHFDLLAATPGEARPSLDEQMSMLRNLLADRFHLTFHRELKVLPVYAMTIAKGGPTLVESTQPGPPVLVNHVYPDRISLPAHNATMAQFASMLQRAVLNRPVVDQTGLTGKYDFTLDWTSDETQFGGQGPTPNPDSTRPDLFAAMRQQLGMKLEATKGRIETLLINRAEHPSEN